MKKLLKFLGILVLVVVLAATGLIGYLTAAEFNPDPVEPVEVTAAARNRSVKVGEMLKIVTFNTGYAGLDRTQDFFMDGGTGVKPESKERVNANLAGILGALTAQNAQVYFLQETDVDSTRTYGVNEVEYYRHGLSLNTAFAANYKVAFVPYPWPPIGKMHSGVTTLTELQVTEATWKACRFRSNGRCGSPTSSAVCWWSVSLWKERRKNWCWSTSIWKPTTTVKAR